MFSTIIFLIIINKCKKNTIKNNQIYIYKQLIIISHYVSHVKYKLKSMFNKNEFKYNIMIIFDF